MTFRERATQSLRIKLPDATLRYAFARQESWLGPTAPRVDLLYTFPSVQHTGLLHFVDELSWYEDNTFIVALELSKFCRLLMKGHPYARGLMAGADALGAQAWPPDFDPQLPLSESLPALNDWLHGLRDAH